MKANVGSLDRTIRIVAGLAILGGRRVLPVVVGPGRARSARHGHPALVPGVPALRTLHLRHARSRSGLTADTGEDPAARRSNRLYR